MSGSKNSEAKGDTKMRLEEIAELTEMGIISISQASRIIAEMLDGENVGISDEKNLAKVGLVGFKFNEYDEYKIGKGKEGFAVFEAL